MIIIIEGGIGEGKSLFVVKEIVSKGIYAYTNFQMDHYKNYHRLKIGDIVKEYKGEKKTEYDVNWDFWNKAREKHPDFSIFIDEIQLVAGARDFMSKRNKVISKWISQIRKIFFDKPHSNLYIISQQARKIDIDIRELAQIFVRVHKDIIGKNVYITCEWFNGYDAFENNQRLFRTRFKGNDYFKYYHSTQILKFEQNEEFLE